MGSEPILPEAEAVLCALCVLCGESSLHSRVPEPPDREGGAP
jgi:hypothetical protein